jgi:hypothetical protein
LPLPPLKSDNLAEVAPLVYSRTAKLRELDSNQSPGGRKPHILTVEGVKE